MEDLAPIEVHEYGAGERTVVVLHGGPGAPGSAAGLGRALAPHFRILEPWQRRAGVVPLSVAQHVEDLAAVAPEKCALVGWSWGAMLGLSYAACLPERVSELVLVGCGTYDLTTRRLLVQTIDERLGEEGRRQMADLQQRIEQEQEPGRRDVLLGELGAAHMKIETYEAGDDGPVPEPALPPDHVGHHETWNDVLRLQQTGVEPARFRAITARVLMLHGDFDPHPGKRTFELLQELVPHLEFMELTRCGHEPWRERHARASFVETLVRWLDRKPA